MKKTPLILLPAALLLSSCVTDSQGNTDWAGAAQTVINSGLLNSTAASALSQTEITAGLKEALNIGSSNVVNLLGRKNGFETEAKIRIPVPDKV